MRIVKYTSRFKRDYRGEKSGQQREAYRPSAEAHAAGEVRAAAGKWRDAQGTREELKRRASDDLKVRNMNSGTPQSAEDIKAFADHCVFMRSVYLHGCILFETSTVAEKGMMERAATGFFGDLNRVLIEYMIQQICKITDPASDIRKNENHTVEFLLQHYNFSSEPETVEKLQNLNIKLKSFRAKLLPARHKFIAHADRAAILDGRILGAAPKGDWDQFWIDLQDLVSTIHKVIVGSPFEINSVAMLSDADGLLNALKHGVCFDQLMHDTDPVITRKCADLALTTCTN
jgi:hypothetical protein